MAQQSIRLILTSFVRKVFVFAGSILPAFLYFIWRWTAISSKELLINEEIREKEVRLIGANGEQLGIMPLEKAQKLAIEANLDLAEIAPNATPPVCKILDYGKYLFEQTKREKEAKKNQKTVEIKEVRLSVNIDTNDFNTKARAAMKFIKGGDKVKVALRFRGREMAHAANGTELLNRFAEACTEVAVVEKPAKLEGRSMIMFLAAKPNK